MSQKSVLAVVCRSLPPMVIGTPILLHNMLSSYKGRFVGIGGWQNDAKTDKELSINADAIHYLRSNYSFIQKIFERSNPLGFEIIKKFVSKKLKQEKADKVLGVCPNGEFFIAGYIAAKKLNLKFYAHMHDLWIENAKEGTMKYKLAYKWEKEILTNADRVFCMTKVQMEHYERKYGIKCDLLPHTIKTENLPDRDFHFNPHRYKNEIKTIVYTGNVNRPINLDAMQQFIKAIDHLPEYFNIKVFISLDENELKALNLFHKRIEYEWKSMEEVKKEMSKAHVLFLPLSFKNCSEAEVKTVFATKTLDYLTSGTPILQFCPEDAFHTQSAKNGNWAYCVTEDDPIKLAKAFEEVVSDMTLCEQLVKGAIREAYSRKSDIHSARLSGFLEADSGK